MGEHCAIMSNKVVFDIMNENIFTSTAMLSAIWEHHKKDNMELMVPFVLYCVGKSTMVGQRVEMVRLIDSLKADCGYEEFPLNVAMGILNRLTPQTFKRKNGMFYLQRSLQKEVADSEKKRSIYKSEEDCLFAKLTDYLNKRCKKHIENSYVRQRLVQFFAKHGIVLLWESYMLDLLQMKRDEIDYFIAQFIIDEQRSDTKEFGYLTERLKGFYIANAIYLQPDNNELYKSKFREVDIYLDTTFLLNALGYKTEQSELAAKELLDMLRSSGARLFCFDHTFKEVEYALSTYQNNLRHPAYFDPKSQTLERFDELNYTTGDVEAKIVSLATQLEALEIQSTATPPYPKNESETAGDSSLIDYQGLEKHIKSRLPVYNKDALSNDIESASAISRLRKGKKSRRIETCTALFVTTNSRLVSAVNYFFHADFKYNEIQFFMTDLAVSALLWLKCYKSKPDYPQLKLIENAYIALEPSRELMMVFYDKIQKSQSNNVISADDAICLCMDRYAKKELMLLTRGDSDALGDDTIITIRDRQRTKYVGEEQKKIQLLSEAMDKSKAAEKEKEALRIKKAKEKASSIAEAAKKKRLGSWKVCTSIVLVLLLLAGIGSIIYSFFANIDVKTKLFGMLPGIIVLAFDMFGAADLLLSRKGVLSTKIAKSGERKYHNVFSEEMNKYKDILEP